MIWWRAAPRHVAGSLDDSTARPRASGLLRGASAHPAGLRIGRRRLARDPPIRESLRLLGGGLGRGGRRLDARDPARRFSQRGVPRLSARIDLPGAALRGGVRAPRTPGAALADARRARLRMPARRTRRGGHGEAGLGHRARGRAPRRAGVRLARAPRHAAPRRLARGATARPFAGAARGAGSRARGLGDARRADSVEPARDVGGERAGAPRGAALRGVGALAPRPPARARRARAPRRGADGRAARERDALPGRLRARLGSLLRPAHRPRAPLLRRLVQRCLSAPHRLQRRRARGGRLVLDRARGGPGGGGRAVRGDPRRPRARDGDAAPHQGRRRPHGARATARAGGAGRDPAHRRRGARRHRRASRDGRAAPARAAHVRGAAPREPGRADRRCRARLQQPAGRDPRQQPGGAGRGAARARCWPRGSRASAPPPSTARG